MKKFKKLFVFICLVSMTSQMLNLSFLSNIRHASSATKATLKTLTASIKVKETINATISNKNKKATYSYTSSDKKVATVTSGGKITGKTKGTATITVKETYNNKTTTVGKMTITVMPVLNYSSMIEKSLVSTGNNYRMKKAIEKAKNGEEVTIAYIGGSITEGYNASSNTKCYAYLSYQHFKETYGFGDGSNVKYVNAGMAGTPSTLGMIRYDRDVLARSESAPDIVFVEFAVNDGDDPTNGDSYESLVRNILNAENQPAVVLLFSVFQSKWNLQSRLQPIGEYYQLPMISIKDAVVPELENGTLTNAEFFGDIYHPTDMGHKIMADCITLYFDTVHKEINAENDIVITDAPKIGTSFVGIKMIDAKTQSDDIILQKGGFSETDLVLGTFKYEPGTKTFPDNFKHSASSGNKSFKMTVTAKNLILVYKLSTSTTAGKVDVYVDGKKTQTIDSRSGGAWNNPVLKILFNEKEAKKHNIEIKMTSDSTTMDFTILGFGYTE